VAPLLEVDDLRTAFGSPPGAVNVLDGVSFGVAEGEILGLVGESGSGKTVTALSITQLLPPAARVVGGSVRLRGQDLLQLPRSRMNRLRGEEIAMVFQQPRASLNPLLRVGTTLDQVLRTHRKLRGSAARKVAIEVLADVGLPEPEQVLSRYPHELSGGMCQRVMIALALASEPKLLVADEPTTALDVTIQLQIVNLLARLRAEHGLALILITHNLGVVAELCDRVVVMYAGKVVEEGPVRTIFDEPRHPYTIGLLRSRPAILGDDELSGIPGQVPDARRRPGGCPFHPRCPYAVERCSTEPPRLEPSAEGHLVSCHRWREVEP
jgi:peptide/nickel transport system ATP-binding protein/oligopeptide transport system ATP-binding protein